MTRGRASCRLAALVVLGALASGGARAGAQPAAEGVACPEGNLLAGRTPRHWTGVRNRIELLTDGAVAQEGATWDAPLAVQLETADSSVTWDLGAPTGLAGLHAQADANDTYTFWGSVDGATFQVLGHIDPVNGQGLHGLRSRQLRTERVVVRYLRVGDARGDRFYSLSEVMAYCRLPDPFPPSPRVEAAPVAQVRKTIYSYWNDETSARWEFVLAILGFALLAWGHRLAALGKPQAFARLRDRLLGALGIIALLTYFNLGFFHFGNYIHNWDTFHYYIGSKYFTELGYDRLYECVAVADSEVPGMAKRLQERKITNLRTNVLEYATDILAHPERCKDRFSPARWESFKHDVGFFRSREGAQRWEDTQTDHGYNGTPIWNIAGTLLTNLGPATYAQVLALTIIDPVLLVTGFGLVWWAFGWRVLAVALLVFATNFPSRFYWTGGSLLRWDWIFHMVAALCCLRKKRYALGGAFLGYATLLRIFPGFMFIGPLLAALSSWRQVGSWRRIDRRYLRFFAGAALAVSLLVPLSFATSGGPRAYLSFYQNTLKHKETPLTNYMGLRTVVAYRPSEVGHRLRDSGLTDPWAKWKAARLRAYQQAKPLFLAVAAGFIALIALAVRGADPWFAAAAAGTFMAVGVELTSYYYAFIVVVALLYERRREVGLWLLAVTAATQFIAWAPLQSRWLAMSRGLDEQSTFQSLVTLVAFAAILWSFGPGARRAEPGVSPAGSLHPEAPAAPVASAGASPVEQRQGGRGARKRKKRR